LPPEIIWTSLFVKGEAGFESSARGRLLDPRRNTPCPRKRINVINGQSADMSGIVVLPTSSMSDQPEEKTLGELCFFSRLPDAAHQAGEGRDRWDPHAEAGPVCATGF
jgi:hypothetical protein